MLNFLELRKGEVHGVTHLPPSPRSGGLTLPPADLSTEGRDALPLQLLAQLRRRPVQPRHHRDQNPIALPRLLDGLHERHQGVHREALSRGRVTIGSLYSTAACTASSLGGLLSCRGFPIHLRFLRPSRGGERGCGLCQPPARLPMPLLRVPPRAPPTSA